MLANLKGLVSDLPFSEMIGVGKEDSLIYKTLTVLYRDKNPDTFLGHQGRGQVYTS